MRTLRGNALYTDGFTLIELLVVVAILSAASLLAFGSFAEDRSQIRYDDTHHRLQSIYRAVLGHNGPLSGGDIAGGFVADNGALPSDLSTLLYVGTLDARSVRSPVFDPKPNEANCENDGSSDDITLSTAAAQLVKGHAGDYLGGLKANGHFRDGWGNVSASDDALNFGWVTSYNSTDRSLSVTSLGLNNAVDAPTVTDYAADQSMTITANDWLLPISGWTVQVRNLRGTDILPNKLSVSLLVYVNRAGGGKWLRYASTSLGCMDGDGDNQVGGLPCSRTAGVAFIDGCKPGVTASGTGRIPQGRHLLILTDNGADGIPWTTDDVLSGGATLTASAPILAQIDAVAGRNLPATSIDIR